MSRQFSDTSTPYNGIIQGLEVAVYGHDAIGSISDNPTQLGIWTSRINSTLDRAYTLILAADGRWNFDDSNHTDYPIITTNLVASQRSYTFTDDENGNLILEVERVFAKDGASSEYRELIPVDAQKDKDTSGYWDGQDTTGSPLTYDKTANAIFLDPVPSANVTDGLKVYISREGSYFSTSDTTKKPGFAGIFHDYLIYRTILDYAFDNTAANMQAMQVRVEKMEREMSDYYGRRGQDERPRLSVYQHNNR